MNTNNDRITAKSTQAPPSHHRAQSETSQYDTEEDEVDDFLDFFDFEKFNFSSFDIMSAPPAASKSTNFASTSRTLSPHLRSFSVDTSFFDGLSFVADDDGEEGGVEMRAHRRTTSMVDRIGKATPPQKLALVDPKRAKRILANRRSAARSKEKRMKLNMELENEVEALRTEYANRAAELVQLEKEVEALTAENKELTLHLQALLEQEKLRAAMKESLKNDIKWLKMELGLPITDEPSAGSEIIHQFPPHTQNLLQQQQPQNQNQNQNQASPCQMPLNPNFLDFNRRV